MNKIEKFIDLDNILKSRSPKTYKYIPSFIIKKLKKIIHEDGINEFMTNNKEYSGQDYVRQILNYWQVKVKYAGIEKIPSNQKYVIASNHPLGGLDGIAILNLVYSFLGNAKAIVNDLLLYIENLRPVFTGVNVFGKLSKTQIKLIDDLYQSDNQVVVFPAGLVSRKVKGVIKDLEWKKSFLTKAIEYKRDIIPVYTDAHNSKFFYNFARFRKFFGIKFNLELIYLPDEMFKFVGKEIFFRFGEPISIEKIKQEKNINYWVDYIRSKSDELKEKRFEKIYNFEPTSS